MGVLKTKHKEGIILLTHLEWNFEKSFISILQGIFYICSAYLRYITIILFSLSTYTL